MSTPNPEEHNRIVSAGINIAKSKLIDKLTPPDESDFRLMQRRFKDVVFKVVALIKPIHDAERDAGKTPDKEAMFTTACNLFVNEIASANFSKDELLYITALVHAGMLIDQLM